jgi:hypothetical protein
VPHSNSHGLGLVVGGYVRLPTTAQACDLLGEAGHSPHLLHMAPAQLDGPPSMVNIFSCRQEDHVDGPVTLRRGPSTGPGTGRKLPAGPHQVACGCCCHGG